MTENYCRPNLQAKFSSCQAKSYVGGAYSKTDENRFKLNHQLGLNQGDAMNCLKKAAQQLCGVLDCCEQGASLSAHDCLQGGDIFSGLTYTLLRHP